MEGKNIALLTTLLMVAGILLLGKPETHKTPLQEFREWRNQYAQMQELTPQEELYRLGVYQKNLEVINQHNQLLGRSYDMGVNQFTALTQEEFEEQYLSKLPARQVVEAPKEETQKGLSLYVDWVTAGAVSPVKSQGSCGATYAFSAVGAIEGAAFVIYKSQVELSVQQIVDCSQSFGNAGCASGTMVASFNYAIAYGLMAWNNYPWFGRLGSCNATGGPYKPKSYINVTSCSALDSAITRQPISVAVDGRNFNFYTSGIFTNCVNSSANVGLAALLVGASDQSGNQYYKLKLSWGSSFGEQGYIRISKAYNSCGICSYPSYPNA